MNYAAEIHARAEQCLKEGLTNDELAGVLFTIARALAQVEPPPRPAYPLIPLDFEEQERIQEEKDAEYGETCGTCGGKGHVGTERHHNTNYVGTLCPTCKGTGLIPLDFEDHGVPS